MATAFPAGVRFCPSDKELVVSYLRRRAEGLPIFPGLVIDFDIYSCEPWKLPDLDFIYGKDGEMFFFTPRYPVSAGRCKNASRSHVRRTAGEGSWESNGSTKSIRDDDDEAIIGSKMALVFKRKDKATGVVTKTDWMMQEYLLRYPPDQFQELALCKIYCNGKEDVAGGQGAPLLKKRKMNSEPSSTCAATFSPASSGAATTHTISIAFSPPEITSCMIQWESPEELMEQSTSDNRFLMIKSASSSCTDEQFLLPSIVVGIEASKLAELEVMPEEQNAAADQETLIPPAFELPAATPATSNLEKVSWEKTCCRLEGPLDDTSSCFEGLDDILKMEDWL